MTASPTAVPPSPADGGSTLAALFAAAASTMHRQMSTDNIREQQHQQRSRPTFAKASLATTTTTNNIATSTKTKQLKKHQIHQYPGTPVAQATNRSTDSDKVSDNNLNNSAANLIASLLNGNAKDLSSPISSTRSSSGQKAASKSSPSSSSSSSSSLPLTKTTATYTTTVAELHQPSNGTTAKPTSVSPKHDLLVEKTPNVPELRNLESWHDEFEGQLDESCYQELVDSGNTDGWSADEMFKYNEKRHKILSSYSEKTLSSEYTTPVTKAKTKTTLRLATKLAKEIEDKVIAEGRVTPESSDDDELFEQERKRRLQMKQLKHLDQLKNLKPTPKSMNHSHSTNVNTTTNMINKYFASTNMTNYQSVGSARKSNRSSSQQSNSSATPATASLSSSPTLNDSNMIMKPVASSSRNILRTCLI